MAIQLNTNCIEHHAFLLNYLASSYEKEEYLDVAFVCKGGKVVKAHQLVLASLSPFLRDLFNESTAPEVSVSLAEVDDRMLTQLLTLMYEGTLKLLASDVQEFQELVEMLDIKFPGDIYINVSPPTLITSTSQNGTEETQSSSAMAILAVEGVSEFMERATGLGDPNDDPLNIPDRYFVKPRGSGSGQPNVNPAQPKPPRVGRSSTSEKSSEGKSSSLKRPQTGASVASRQTSATNEGTSQQNINGPVHDVTKTESEPVRNKKRKRGTENAGEKLVKKNTRSKDKEANTT